MKEGPMRSADVRTGVVLGLLLLAFASPALKAEEMAAEQATTEALRAQAELRAQTNEATKEFLGLNWSLGIGVASDLDGGGRVDKASVVNGIVRIDEKADTQARIFLEIHMFGLGQLMKGHSFEDADPKPLYGQGPWVGIQSSKDQVVDSFGLGWMVGWRKSETTSSSFNIGLGLLLDPKVQVLGDGIKANQPLPAGETEVRFKTESRLSGALLVSFSF